MRFLLTPYDITTCSLAARGALLLGELVLAAFPEPGALFETGLCTQEEVVRTLHWAHPAVRRGIIAFDKESTAVWDKAVAVRERIESGQQFGSLCPQEDPVPQPDERSRRMAMDVMRGGRDAWAKLAHDIAAEEYAQSNMMALARTRSTSRGGQIEHALGETLFRFTLGIPGEQHAKYIPDLRDQLGHQLELFSTDLSGLIRSAQHGETPPGASSAVLRAASGRLTDEITEIADSEGWGVQHAAVACVRYPAGITALAARAALGLSSSTAAGTRPSRELADTLTVALILKPMGGGG
jgi:hypothetical protein